MDAHRHHLSQHLNTPTVMVSHCWASPFQDVVQIMGRYDENTNKSNFFFFDVFSMNQHDLSDLSGPDRKDQPGQDMYDVMLEALTNSIRTPRRVLLALTPHHEPQLLSRSWCLGCSCGIFWGFNVMFGAFSTCRLACGHNCAGFGLSRFPLVPHPAGASTKYIWHRS